MIWSTRMARAQPSIRMDVAANASPRDDERLLWTRSVERPTVGRPSRPPERAGTPSWSDSTESRDSNH